MTEHVVGIAAKPTHPRSTELTGQLVRWLKEHQHNYRLGKDIADRLEIPETERHLICSRKDLVDTCSVIVVLGGDGTLISVSRHPKKPAPIVLGVNLGTMGFLTEITPDEMLTTLAQVLQEKARLETRSLLEAEVRRHGERILLTHAINDVVLNKAALARIFATELHVDGESAAEIRGDGLIVSTPAGSTAYSVSAGGSIVHPAVEALLITAICPHSLTCRPLVLPGQSKIALRVISDIVGERDKVFLTIDGQEGMELQEGDEISVTTSDYSVKFAKSLSKNYFDVLEAKLSWAHR